MAEMIEPRRYCLACGADNAAEVRICRDCGRSLAPNALQEQQGLAFLLNELQHLHTAGEIDDELYLKLSLRYRAELAGEGEEARLPEPAPAVRAKPAAPKREGPGFLAEQQANLLLYLGAFLIVVAALTFVSASSESITDSVRMALLALGTVLFLAAGLVCMRIPRVEQAGVVFFAAGSLMVPIDFIGAYAIFGDGEISARSLWLAGSLTSALFYGAVSLTGIGRWYSVPMSIALISGLGATLVLADAPPEAYPGSYIGLGIALGVPSMLAQGRVRDAWGTVGLLAGHAVVAPALLIALAMTLNADERGDFELVTRWYLPPTAALGALFYWAQMASAQRSASRVAPVLTVLALAVTAAAAVTVVFALDVGERWYGPAVAIVGWLYAAAGAPYGPRWIGRSHLGWMSLGAITVSWLLFEGIYDDFPRQGAGVHLAAAAFYLVVARTPAMRSWFSVREVPGERFLPARLLAPTLLVYAAGLTIGIGFYHLISSLPAAETGEVSDLSLAFFGLSLGIATVAVTMRWWWAELRVHAYAIAIAISLFVLLASADASGQVTVLLAVYAAAALAVALWEREPVALAMPAVYGLFALFAAWRFYEPTDLYLPLVVSAGGYVLFAGYVALRTRAAAWSQAALVLAFVYAAAAPIAGWVRLAILADPDGFVADRPFEETALYQTSAASLMLLGLLGAALAAMLRRLDLAAVASALLLVALLLEIGHFRPENVQAYTAPVGVYLLVATALALRVRGLPSDLGTTVELLQGVGAAVLMGPSLVQSWEDGGWPYALIVLGEGLALLGLALVQRWLWLLAVAVGFIALAAMRYLFLAAQGLPSWAVLAIAGTLVMAAGIGILLGRERWIVWQRSVQAWWRGETHAHDAA